jgi:hypothetical protein
MTQHQEVGSTGSLVFRISEIARESTWYRRQVEISSDIWHRQRKDIDTQSCIDQLRSFSSARGDTLPHYTVYQLDNDQVEDW